MRSIYSRQLKILVDRRHLALGCAHEHILQRFCVQTELWSCLQHYAVQLRESVHVGSIATSDIAGKHAEHVSWRNTVPLALDSVHFNEVHRELGVE